MLSRAMKGAAGGSEVKKFDAVANSVEHTGVWPMTVKSVCALVDHSYKSAISLLEVI